jgi:hypothetical protein
MGLFLLMPVIFHWHFYFDIGSDWSLLMGGATFYKLLNGFSYH